jgi:hypothetical protein
VDLVDEVHGMSDIEERKTLSDILGSCAALSSLTCPHGDCRECSKSADVYKRAMESAWSALLRLDASAANKDGCR